jgi:hypothetical protein
MGKDWYKSKTLWFGILFGLVQVAGLLGFKTYQPNADTNEIVGIVVAIIIVVLRKLTTDPLK